MNVQITRFALVKDYKGSKRDIEKGGRDENGQRGRNGQIDKIVQSYHFALERDYKDSVRRMDKWTGETRIQL